MKDAVSNSLPALSFACSRAYNIFDVFLSLRVSLEGVPVFAERLDRLCA